MVRLDFGVGALTLAVLIVLAAPCQAQGDQTSGLSDFAWGALRAIKPGTEVLVTTRGAQPARRYFLRATDAELTILNLSDAALTQSARRRLRGLASTRPDAFLGTDRPTTFVTGDVRVATDGVFIGRTKVTEAASLIERRARAELVAVRELDSGAQWTATSFEELPGLIRRGETIEVTDATGRTTRGILAELAPGSLELRVAQPTAADAAVLRTRREDIRSIQVRRADPLWNGALIGFAAAGGLPLLGLGTGCSHYLNACDGIPAFSALAVGVGLLIDWARKDTLTIFPAPGQRSPAVSLSPLVSKSAAGVQMSVRF